METKKVLSGSSQAEQDPEKTNEKNLARSEEVFRLLVEVVDEYAIFALDPEGFILTWNQGARRLKGYAADEVIGTHFSRFYTKPDIDRDHPRHELELAVRNGKYEEEGWRVRKDGTTFWANVVITALRDEAGALRGFGKVTRDLTARRTAELALRESEERFRLMVESVQDYAIFMLDPAGRVSTWNKGAERNKGYQAHEIVGKHFSTFYPEEDKRAGKPDWELKEAVSAGRFEDEGWRVRKDGSRFWANVVITPMFGDGGELFGFVKVTRNLTERKKAEEALREANADLEDKVRARTRELTEAKARAERAVKARDEFFSMASHELKTPLSSLKMQTQLRKRNLARGDVSDFEPGKLKELCEDDEKQVVRLSELVDRMLDISRLSSGNFDLVYEAFDLGEAVKDALKRVEPILKESGNAVSFRAPAAVVGAWDRLRVEQIVTNLLTNAGKYAAGRPVEVFVERDGDGAVITVHDHGKGIPETERERIFEPFERLQNFGDSRGLGLGLYITKRMVEAHGGRISVEGGDGSGCSFVVKLPLAAAGKAGNG